MSPGPDVTLARDVAVKAVHPELAIHSSIAQRFLAEARMIARLRHPNIVTVYTAGEADDILYFVMDRFPGESLRERLNREGKLPPEEARRITMDIAAAIDAAASAGLVHRDVKPENILLEAGAGGPCWRISASRARWRRTRPARWIGDRAGHGRGHAQLHEPGTGGRRGCGLPQ